MASGHLTPDTGDRYPRRRSRSAPRAVALRYGTRCGENGFRVNPASNRRENYYYYYNRGKKSVTLDLSKPEAKPIIKKLVEWADVLT